MKEIPPGSMTQQGMSEITPLMALSGCLPTWIAPRKNLDYPTPSALPVSHMLENPSQYILGDDQGTINIKQSSA